jgi:riboflavin synthase
MFTGIIEEVGHIARIAQNGENRRITVTAQNVTRELRTGHSVAVSGVCLTALDITPSSFSADLAPETWARTSLSRLKEGARVNLELPLKADGRMGGHIVQGHVDGVGRLIELERIPDSENWWLHIEVSPELEKYLVYKGSISIEGISLTVAKLEGLRCTIAIIPHTVEMTNLSQLNPGDPVNVETDIVAKYLEKWFHRDRLDAAQTPSQRSLSIDALTARGF